MTTAAEKVQEQVRMNKAEVQHAAWSVLKRHPRAGRFCACGERSIDAWEHTEHLVDEIGRALV